MSRQFTDGEIVVVIKRIVAEGVPLSRAAVRKYLGGGSSSRISAMIKDYREGAPEAPPHLGAIKVSPPMDINATLSAAGSSHPAPLTTSLIDQPADSRIAQLQSEIRVLKILLESERDARREEEARYCRTIEALQREVEIAGLGRSSCAPGKNKKNTS